MIHDSLTTSILGTTLRWLDGTPTGRIITRFSLDIRAVDGPLSSMLQNFLELSASQVTRLREDVAAHNSESLAARYSSWAR